MYNENVSMTQNTLHSLLSSLTVTPGEPSPSCVLLLGCWDLNGQLQTGNNTLFKRKMTDINVDVHVGVERGVQIV